MASHLQCSGFFHKIFSKTSLNSSGGIEKAALSYFCSKSLREYIGKHYCYYEVDYYHRHHFHHVSKTTEHLSLVFIVHFKINNCFQWKSNQTKFAINQINLLFHLPCHFLIQDIIQSPILMIVFHP